MPRVNQDTNQALIELYNPRTGQWINDTKDILLRYLQDLFYQAPAGQDCFHLEPGDTDYGIDEKESELIVTDQATVNTDTLEKRPAIILSRGPFAYGNISVGNLQGLTFTTGQKKQTDLVTGSFVLNCISSVGIEAERLANIVARGLRAHRVLLQKAGFFNIGDRVQVGQETSPNSLVSGGSAEDFVNVPVILPVAYQDWYSIEQANTPLLNRIVFKAVAVFRNLDFELLVPDAINQDGTVNESSEGVIVAQWTVPPTTT